MSNNFVRVGNLSGDAVLDGGAEKIHFESVLGGVGDPSGAPDPDSKTWLYVDKSQDPVALWVWDPGPARWNRTGDGGAGGDVHSPMAPVLGGEPAQFADNTGKLLAAAAVNVVNGLMRLDGNAEVPESFIPSTIARDTEVASAISTHSAATDPHGDRGYTDAQIAAINAAAVGARPDSWVPAWSEVTSKPTEFPPSAHTHPQSDVTGLVSDLAAKVANTDPRLSDARTPLAHTHAATAVTSVPATTGLDPASTNVEAALTELAARPSGGTFPILCTSTTRPTGGLFTGMHIYETDTGTLLVYAGATAGFRPPWNLPWGRVAHTKITAVAGGYTGTAVDVTGLTASVSQVAGRRYRIQVHLEVSSSVVTDIGLLTVTGSDNVAIARAVPYFAHGGAHTVTLTHVEDASSTATVTRKCRYNRAIGSGTHQIEASSQFPCTILIEDIGPTGNPS